MTDLLRYTVVSEPDIHRMTRFVLDAVQTLSGDVFMSSTRLLNLLPNIRDGIIEDQEPMEVVLELDNVETTQLPYRRCDWQSQRWPADA